MENIVQGQWFRGPSADLGEEISQSLRFNSGGYLKRAQLTTGDGLVANNRTWTFSTWFKHGDMGETQIFGFHTSSANNWILAWTAGASYDTFLSRDHTGWQQYDSSQKFRDPNAWYHIFITCSSGVMTMKINNVARGGTVTQNHSMDRDFVLGAETNGGSTPMDGYLAETYFIQNTVLDPVNDGFIRLNEDGVYVPDTPTISSYGTNGWHLTYDSSQANGIGHDSSGNGNHFTASSFDTAAISSANRLNDIDIADTPTSNYATFNPLWHRTTPSVKGGNLELTTATTIAGQANFRFPVGTTGKYWVEAGTASYGATNNSPAILITDQLDAAPPSGTAWSTTANYSGIGGHSGDFYTNFNSTTANSYTEGSGQVALGINFDDEEVLMYNNGSLINTDTTVDFTKELAIVITQPDSTYNTYDPYINAGQQTHIQSAPTGYTALQTNNLPEPTIKDGSEHFEAIKGTGTAGFIVYPQPNSPTPTATSAADFTSETAVAVTSSFTSGINRQAFVFDTVSEITNTAVDIDSQSGGYWGSRTVNAYVSATGAANSWTQVVTNQAFHVSNANTVTIPAQTDSYRYIKLLADTTSNSSWATGDGLPILTHAQNTFASGLYMIKPDASSQVFYYIDPINGTSAAHRTPLPTSTASYTAYNGNAYAWCWNCPDTFTATGITAGRRNVTAGFSIVKYTGDNTNPRSIPHGLGRKVGWVILWNPEANDTTCFITGLPGTGTNTENLIWNTAEAASNQFSAGTQHTPTDVNNFIVGNSAGGSGVTGVNQNSISYTAFCWAPIPGYSKMGTYSGNASTEGPFIYCGFKPKWVLIKSQGADHWHIYDTIRDVNNPCDRVFLVNDSGSETDAGGNANIDILSNGFKLRGANGAINGSNNYNYVAFAEHPFGGVNTPPATAR